MVLVATIGLIWGGWDININMYVKRTCSPCACNWAITDALTTRTSAPEGTCCCVPSSSPKDCALSTQEKRSSLTSNQFQNRYQLWFLWFFFVVAILTFYFRTDLEMYVSSSSLLFVLVSNDLFIYGCIRDLWYNTGNLDNFASKSRKIRRKKTTENDW